jgi:hypothetical protein
MHNTVHTLHKHAEVDMGKNGSCIAAHRNGMIVHEFVLGLVFLNKTRDNARHVKFAQQESRDRTEWHSNPPLPFSEIEHKFNPDVKYKTADITLHHSLHTRAREPKNQEIFVGDRVRVRVQGTSTSSLFGRWGGVNLRGLLRSERGDAANGRIKLAKGTKNKNEWKGNKEGRTEVTG